MHANWTSSFVNSAMRPNLAVNTDAHRRRFAPWWSGEWKGYRSSRLGLQYRVIYRVLAVDMLQVISVTAHDYRRI